MSYTRIWITGSSGRLGSALCRLLTNIEYRILPSDLDVPIGDSEAVNHFADVSHPDVIINCAGLTDVQKCEASPEEAYKARSRPTTYSRARATSRCTSSWSRTRLRSTARASMRASVWCVS